MKRLALTNNWRLGVIAALLVGVGFDSDVPYFNERFWVGAYLLVATSFLFYWWHYTREWLLRSSSLLCTVTSLRALSFAFDGRIGAFCVNALIVAMTWILYGLRSSALPRDDGGA